MEDMLKVCRHAQDNSWGVMQKPDADSIEGISPAISIDQRKASHNPRSTFGTITEIL